MRWKTRTVREFAEDPRGDFMVGRLVGAAEIAATRLQQQGGELSELGERLEEMVRWFLETEPVKTTFGRTIEVPRRAEPLVVPTEPAEAEAG